MSEVIDPDTGEITGHAVAIQAPQARALAAHHDNSQSMAFLRMIEAAAMRPDFDVAKLNALCEVKQRVEADEARKAFTAAKAAFKAEPIVIKKDRDNIQYKSRYTSLGNLLDSVRPFLSKHGLSAEFDQDQTDGLVVTCRLSHALGHSESSSFKVPPDTSGAKNPIQALKSAITYGRAVTFEAVCGLAATDANVDDDGAASGAAVATAKNDMAANLLNGYEAQLNAADTVAKVSGIWEAGLVALKETGNQAAQAELRGLVIARRDALKEGAGVAA